MSCRDKKPQLGKLQTPERNHYYYGKLLDERNLEMEQDYFNHMRWLLNRLGLGAGILCGLDVTLSKDGKQLCISPGVAVDAMGREIIVPEPWCFDPWLITDRCGHVKETLSREKPYEITICLAYHECYADYAPVLVTDCNIKEQCAPGTIRESFTVIISKGLPKTNTVDNLCEALNSQAADSSERRQHVCEVTSGACATPSEETCVILAGVILEEGGKISEKIRPCEYRTTLYSNERLFEMILCLAGHGAAGPKGDPGSKWFTGSTDPVHATPANAVDDDCYLNTVSGHVFAKTSGTWSYKGDIRGPTGPQGPPGTWPKNTFTRITEISWEHDGEMKFADFPDALTVTFSSNVVPTSNNGRAWFIVSIETPFGGLSSTYNTNYVSPTNSTTTVSLNIMGEYKVDNQSISFLPDPVFITAIRTLDQSLSILCRVTLKCDFIIDEKGRAVDGNHLHGKLPSGDNIEGGQFESWFFIVNA